MTNVTSSNVTTPPKKIRSRMMIPNGKETDGSIHYDEARVMTDADLVELVNYIKYGSVAAILSDDDVQTAIAKLDSRDDDLEAKVKKAQQTADLAVQKADAAQATANTARSEAQAAQNTANTAVAKADAAKSAADAAQSTANAAQSAAANAQAAANAAQSAADAAKTAAANAGTTTTGPNGSFKANINVGGLDKWVRAKNNGTWYASMLLSWDFAAIVTSVTISGGVFLDFNTGVSHKASGSFEITLSSGNMDWIKTYKGGTVNVSFTVRTGDSSKDIASTVTIPAYSGQTCVEWEKAPSANSLAIAG